MVPFPFLDGLPRLMEGKHRPRIDGLIWQGRGGVRARMLEGDWEECGGGDGGQACGGTGTLGELTFNNGEAAWPES